MRGPAAFMLFNAFARISDSCLYIPAVSIFTLRLYREIRFGASFAVDNYEENDRSIHFPNWKKHRIKSSRSLFLDIDKTKRLLQAPAFNFRYSKIINAPTAPATIHLSNPSMSNGGAPALGAVELLAAGACAVSVSEVLAA
jgi:hypothetical protein